MPRTKQLILLILLFIIPVLAQNPEVVNVRFEQNGNQIVIQYDLAGKIGKKYTVSAVSSDNGGRTYGIELYSVKGDIGRNISPGYGKTITWDMLKDYPRGLEGDDFVFAVNAKLQKSSKKWPYLLGAAAVGGAVIYAILPKPAEDETGSVLIRVPADI
jgi:hypothetical protein